MSDPKPPTLSRWGRSSYETDADLAAEAATLAPLVELRGTAHDAEILVVTSNMRIDARTLDQTPSVRLVITTTSGFDHLDLPALRGRGIRACRLPEARRDAVVEASLELIIAGLRQSGWLRAQARQGRWARASLPQLGIRTLRGSTVGIVGLGVIGERMARVLWALGARVLGHDPYAMPEGIERVSLEQLLQESEVVTLHCRLTHQTRNILSRERLESARPGLVVVNTARGELLDLAAAVELLEQGFLAGVGVDVFPQEPYPGLSLCADIPGLLFTPHAAGYHDGLPAAVRKGLARAVSAWVAGGPLPYEILGD